MKGHKNSTSSSSRDSTAQVLQRLKPDIPKLALSQLVTNPSDEFPPPLLRREEEDTFDGPDLESSSVSSPVSHKVLEEVSDTTHQMVGGWGIESVPLSAEAQRALPQSTLSVISEEDESIIQDKEESSQAPRR